MLAAGRFGAAASATAREGSMVKDIIRRIVKQMFDMRGGGNLGAARGGPVTKTSKDMGKWEEYAREDLVLRGKVDPSPRYEGEGTAGKGYVKEDLNMQRS
jgi:hypothetical protein